MRILAAADIMTAFDIIIIIFGVYTVYSAIMMKKTKLPGKWLVGELELEKCDDEAGFAKAMAPKTMFFGIIVVVYGIITLLNQFLWSNKVVNIVSTILFVAVCVYFIVELNRKKQAYNMM